MQENTVPIKVYYSQFSGQPEFEMNFYETKTLLKMQKIEYELINLGE